jgi:hypothetical protein
VKDKKGTGDGGIRFSVLLLFPRLVYTDANFWFVKSDLLKDQLY